MKISFTNHFRTSLRFIATCFVMLQFGWQATAQITTVDCQNTYSYCSMDTVKLAPANLTDYTNYVWYANDADVAANEITAANAASFNVDPARLGDSTIYVIAPGGTYILTSEYNTPSGCATKNDTLVINFLPVPDLVAMADTICQSAGESSDLTALVSDANSTAGTMAWYPTLADAQAESNEMAVTTVNPTSTTKYYVRKNTTAADAETEACYDIDSVTVLVSCLNLGNYVWYDTNNNSTVDAGEVPIPGVVVELYADTDGNGVLTGAEQTPIATKITDPSGLYLFENLTPGDYIVGIPGGEFGSGEPLENLYSSGTTGTAAGSTSETAPSDPDASASDTDDNGQEIKSGPFAGDVMSQPVTLDYETEPTGEMPDNSTIADNNDNLTVDFGFYGMSIGSQVFADVNNNGMMDGGESGIAGVTVTLYAADGTTVIATTMTDADGQYLFTNLPEGDYIVGVDLSDPDLSGYDSSDDIASSGTPSSADSDDNGTDTSTSGEIRSNTFTLDAGMAPTGEVDQGETQTGLGNPSTTDNSLTPDGNSDMQIDFGFKLDCPTITNPMGEQTICAGDMGNNLSVDINVDSMIAFVRFGSQQTATAMYSGGAQVGSDVDPTGSANPYTATYTFNTVDFPNTSNTTPDTFYVYGIFANPPSDPTCRPFQEIRVIVNPLPLASDDELDVCESTLGGGQASFILTDADSDVLNGQTGMAVTYHASQADANTGANDLTSPYTSSTATVYARVENTYGCYATSEVDLTVDGKPDFNIFVPTTCPGDTATVVINMLTGGDAILSLMQLNTEGFAPYQANTVFTTADGLNLNAVNTVTVRNEHGCETPKTINVPDIVPLVCPPVNVNVIRNGQ